MHWGHEPQICRFLEMKPSVVRHQFPVFNREVPQYAETLSFAFQNWPARLASLCIRLSSQPVEHLLGFPVRTEDGFKLRRVVELDPPHSLPHPVLEKPH